MELYRERQFGWFIMVLGIVFPIFLIYAYNYQIGTNPISLQLLLLLLPIIAIPLFIFSEMKTIVYSDRFEVKFGYGIIKKVFPFSDLALGIEKRIPWYYGAGIKNYNNGILYSVNSTNAVEFKLKYKRTHIAIGSKNPKVLLDTINRAIQTQSEFCESPLMK